MDYSMPDLPVPHHLPKFAQVHVHCFGDTIQQSHLLTTNSLEYPLMLGKIEGRKRREHQKMRWLDGITDAIHMNLGKLWEMVRDGETWHAAVHGVTRSWTRLDD